MLAGLLPWGGPVAGQPAEDPAWSGALQGRALALGRFYPDTGPDALYQWQGEGRLTLEGSAAYGAHWQGKAALLANVNPWEGRRTRLWINEAYLQFRRKNYFLKAGKQTVKWGALTGFSALDLVNRYDYYDVLDTERERLGLWGLEGRLSKGKTELLLRAFVPDNRSRLYLEDNRWVRLPRQMTLPGAPEATVPMAFQGSEPAYNARLPLLGLSLSTEFGRWQVRGSWLYGNNDIPLSRIVLEEPPGNPAAYTVDLLFEPILIGALNVGAWAGEWNLWAEAAYIDSRRFASPGVLSPDRYAFCSLGADRFWQFEQPERTLRLLAQFLRVFADPETAYEPTELDHIFQTSVLLDAELQLSYSWGAALRAVGEWKARGYYLEPRLICRAWERFRLEISASWLGGAEQGFFGHFRSNSRISLLIIREIL